MRLASSLNTNAPSNCRCGCNLVSSDSDYTNETSLAGWGGGYLGGYDRWMSISGKVETPPYFGSRFCWISNRRGSGSLFAMLRSSCLRSIITFDPCPNSSLYYTLDNGIVIRYRDITDEFSIKNGMKCMAIQSIIYCKGREVSFRSNDVFLFRTF